MNRHAYGCNSQKLKNVRESRPPRPYGAMGECDGMNDFEAVANLVVLPETVSLY